MEEISESYIALKHSISPLRVISSPYYSSKLYSMRSVSKEHFDLNVVERVNEVISREVVKGVVDPHLGLGFSIISNGFLNVSFWGGEYPSLLNNYLFSFKNFNDFENSLKPLDIRDSGTYCVWELAVVSHEAKAWRQFLYGPRTQRDKRRYLEDFLLKTEA